MDSSATPSATVRNSPSDYLVDINKVLLAIADNELLLNSSELSRGLYEDLSSQEDTLRVDLLENEMIICELFCDIVSYEF